MLIAVVRIAKPLPLLKLDLGYGFISDLVNRGISIARRMHASLYD
jgi:hypothetical protein